jgi:outer membrane protein assembly factor BamB
MRVRTAVVLGGLLVILGAGLVVGLGGIGASPFGGTFEESWVSDTPRDNEFNHHAIGAGSDGDVLVAPVTEQPGGDAELTDASCSLVRLAADDGETLWRDGMPPEACFTHALTEPAIDDIDGDGKREVAVATTEEALVVYDGTDGSEQWRVPLSTYGYARPTIANVTAADGPEIVASDIGGGVVLAHSNGTVAWRVALNETVGERQSVYQSAIVEDFDGDGRPEILVGTTEALVLLSADGTVEWQRDDAARYVASVETDGGARIVAAGTSTIRAHDGASGTETWNRSITNGRIHTVADGDGDDTPEVYLGRIESEVVVLDAESGDTEWSTTVSGEDTIVAAPRLGDVTGDGRPEVLAAARTGTVTALDADSGGEVAVYERAVPVWTFVTPADIDGDGRDEVLVRYGDGRVVALEYASS